MKWLVTRTAIVDRTENYTRWIGEAGVEPVVEGERGPWSPGDFDALFLTGGVDVDPDRYGAQRHRKTLQVDGFRDGFEAGLIHEFLAAGRPVFGVCRGIQILAVALGGRLVQHVPDEPAVKACRERHRVSGRCRGDATHGLVFKGRSRLRSALDGVTDVNSSHHQAVHARSIGKGLRVTAASPAGIVEAVEGDGLPAHVLAVQWHPERLPEWHGASRGLLDLMLSLCGHRGRKRTP